MKKTNNLHLNFKDSYKVSGGNGTLSFGDRGSLDRYYTNFQTENLGIKLIVWFQNPLDSFLLYPRRGDIIHLGKCNYHLASCVGHVPTSTQRKWWVGIPVIYALIPEPGWYLIVEINPYSIITMYIIALNSPFTMQNLTELKKKSSYELQRKPQALKTKKVTQSESKWESTDKYFRDLD